MTDRATVKAVDNTFPASLLLGALLVLLLLLACQLWLSYRDQVRTAEISTRNLAAIFATRLDATLRRTDADLKALVNDIPTAALNMQAVPRYKRELNANLDGRMFNMEEMAGFRVHDADGNTLYSSDSAHTAQVNIADREYFRLLRDDPAAGLVFSDVVTGRSTGKQVLVIAMALRDEHGAFKGIVHGMINLEYYRQQFQALNLGEQGVVALRRSDNHAMVVRCPELPEQTNMPLAPSHPVVERMASGEQLLTLHYSVHPENIPRIMSIERMHNYPFYFAVAFGRDDVLAGWYLQAMVVGVLVVMLSLLVGGVHYRLKHLRVREAGILSSLEQSEVQFRELAQMVPVGISHFDRAGKCTYVNDRHMAITGRTREELLGCDWSGFVHPDDRKKIPATWAQRVRPGKAFVCEFRFEHPDGQLTYVLAEVQTETDREGRVIGYNAALTDINQRKQAEAELLVAKQEAESANIAKTRFLAAASHDLRQPIQAISLFRDALGRTDLSEEQITISRFLSMSVHSLGELLYSLLDISKLDAGQVRPQLQAVQVEDLFKAVDAEFSTLARQKNLRFKLFYPFKGIVFVTDPGLLLSVLRNLIDNALKYTERGGVLVGVRQRAGKGVIQVWDTGIGIEAQYGEQVFDECFQVGNPVRDRTKGLGLGLSIVRRLVRLLDGEVSYRSRFGRGTMFEIILPLAGEGAVLEERVTQQVGTGLTRMEDEDFSRFNGWRVVVIEDDLMVAKSIELSLKILGVSVKVWSNAEQALSDPEILGADFYISDFSLPGLNGLQLLDAIQQRSAISISAVLVTGDTSPERIELTTSSPWTVLFKPVDLSALLVAMNEVMVTEGG